MKVQKYNEFHIVLSHDKKKILEKKPTERGSVMIDKFTAEIMNADWKKNKILFELAEETETEVEKPKKQGRPAKK